MDLVFDCTDTQIGFTLDDTDSVLNWNNRPAIFLFCLSCVCDQVTFCCHLAVLGSDMAFCERYIDALLELNLQQTLDRLPFGRGRKSELHQFVIDPQYPWFWCWCCCHAASEPIVLQGNKTSQI